MFWKEKVDSGQAASVLDIFIIIWIFVSAASNRNKIDSWFILSVFWIISSFFLFYWLLFN